MSLAGAGNATQHMACAAFSVDGQSYDAAAYKDAFYPSGLLPIYIEPRFICQPGGTTMWCWPRCWRPWELEAHLCFAVAAFLLGPTILGEMQRGYQACASSSFYERVNADVSFFSILYPQSSCTSGASTS